MVVAAQMAHPVVCIVGMSGSGKTTLIEQLIPALRRRGLRVGTVKHMNHDFDIDRPGKDSWRHREAGASATLIASPFKWALVATVEEEPSLEELLPRLPVVDIVLAEGYKRWRGPKVEVYRPELHDRPVCEGDQDLVAIVTDAPLDLGVPRFSLNEVEALSDYLVGRFALGIPSDSKHHEAVC